LSSGKGLVVVWRGGNGSLAPLLWRSIVVGLLIEGSLRISGLMAGKKTTVVEEDVVVYVHHDIGGLDFAMCKALAVKKRQSRCQAVQPI
jgi:hypothetical protein